MPDGTATYEDHGEPDHFLAGVGLLLEHPVADGVAAGDDPFVLLREVAGAIAAHAGLFAGSRAAAGTLAEILREFLDACAAAREDEAVHAVLLQHPLPSQLDEQEALLALGAEKDADGITPQSLGRLVADLPGFRCATPHGIIRILEHYGIRTEGKRAVVIGRSVILGKPMALMLLQKNATVTVAHSKTQDLPDLCRQADILVAAVGRPEMVKGDWIKPGAVVIDAGYNKVEGRKGDVGDVEFESASEVASWITPVPGGVGPMTRAMLLANVVEAAERSAR